MTIVYVDGGKLECSTLTLCGNIIIADDIYIIYDYEIDYITDYEID